MIGVPFDNNDLSCLGSITEIVANLVQIRHPVLVDLSAKFRTTSEIAAWIRSLPQRNDDGVPDDGPKVEACTPVQRLRIPAPDPNCVERAALYLALAELMDPWPLRQLATLDFEWGRHTFPIENGTPVVLDPRASYQELLDAIPPEHRTPVARPVDATELPVDHPASAAPVVVDIHDAIDFTSEMASQGAGTVRNGPSRVHIARNALQNFVATGTPPKDARTADAIGWFFSIAEQIARRYGRRALTIVRTTAVAISELIDDVLAERQAALAPRNLSLEIGGASFGVPSWLTRLGALVGKVGLDVGAIALAPKLAALGISGQMLELVEQELNAEGLTLGPLSKPGRSFASAFGALAAKQSR